MHFGKSVKKKLHSGGPEIATRPRRGSAGPWRAAARGAARDAAIPPSPALGKARAALPAAPSGT